MVNVEQVKELRAKTHFGMTDCKNALQDAQGDMEEAIKLLQKKGLKKVDSLFEAVEGEVKAISYGDKGVIAEINCQTDFAARSEPFQKFVKGLFENRKLAFDPAPEVAEEQKNLSAVLGEVVRMRRLDRLSSPGNGEGMVRAYNHPGGKIAVLVSFDFGKGSTGGTVPSTPALEFTDHVAMHIAAANPKYVHRTDVPVDLVAQQKEIFRTELPSGKSEQQYEKIIEGKLNRWYGEYVLMEQQSMINPKKKISEVLSSEGGGIQAVLEFKRFERGEVISS